MLEYEVTVRIRFRPTEFSSTDLEEALLDLGVDDVEILEVEEVR